MFRRSKSEPAPDAGDAPVKEGGKGRPTPSRKEAEAAARERAKVPKTRKELAQRQRHLRSESSQKMRAAMKSGDERFLPSRDRGPVRRFIRDFIDVRFSFVELMIPLMILTLVLGWSGNPQLMMFSNAVLLGTLLMVVFDLVMLRFRLRKELARRFPDEPLKGTTYYAMVRAMQMRFMRLPKSQVKIGQTLPDTYR